MGGYVGSALFGNFLLYIGLCKPKLSITTLYVIIGLLIFSAIWWYSSIFTSTLLILFSAIYLWISRKSKLWISNILIIIGTSSIIFIIMDYKNGPASDLTKFANIMPILSKSTWAVIWLIFVIIITAKTLITAYKK